MTDYTQLPADLPVPSDDGAADHLPGLSMPPLRLPTSDGGSVDLADLGPGRTILYLYPMTGQPGVALPDGWDEIPGARGCSTEACDFRDHAAELRNAGAARVYGMSSQDVEYQDEVVRRLRLPFVMISDEQFALADALNLPTFAAEGHPRLYARLTLVVAGGVIEHVFYPIFPPNTHAQEVHAWLRTQTPDAPHRHREVAESFGADAERYDRARPRYPDELIERIVAAAPGPEVLDVGVGTGIVARQLVAAGCRVLGVDVDDRMAGYARSTGIAVETAKFEDWDTGGRSFDAVVAGQTWHWIDPERGVAKAAEVLRPRGLLVVFWNAQQPPADLAEAFAAVYERVVPDSLPARGLRMSGADPYGTMAGTAADGIRRSGGFSEPEEWRFGWQRTYTTREWLDVLPTQGGHQLFTPDQLREVLAGVGAALDAAGGSMAMDSTTVAVVAARQGPV